MNFIKRALSFGVPFGVGMGVYFSFQYDLLLPALIGGITAGLLFGISMAFYMGMISKRLKKIEENAKEVIGNQKIIFSSGANTLDGFFAKLGWLTLTSTHLIFVPEMNKKTNPPRIEIALSAIEEVTPTKHRLNRNAILVVYEGKSQKFLIDSMDPKLRVKNIVWVAKINLAIRELKKAIE